MTSFAIRKRSSINEKQCSDRRILKRRRLGPYRELLRQPIGPRAYVDSAPNTPPAAQRAPSRTESGG